MEQPILPFMWNSTTTTSQFGLNIFYCMNIYRRQSLMSTLVVHVLVCGARTIIVAQVLTDRTPNNPRKINVKRSMNNANIIWFRYLNQKFLRNRYIHSQAACFSLCAPESVDLVLLVSTWITIDFPKRNVMKLTGYMRGT